MMKKNEFDLTREEKAVLQESGNPAIRRFAASNLDKLTARVLAFQKIAQAARAERRAIEETVLLELVKEGIPGYEELRQHVSDLKTERDKLQADKHELYTRLGQNTAKSALVEHGEPTKR